MRITGGEFGGRKVKAPAGDRVRPTQDRVRGALFSMLAEIVPGARVLDLFAGSGSVGLDAFSRGAAAVVWVEGDRCHAQALKANVAALAVDTVAATVVCCDVLRWLRTPAGLAPFDIVFADPPYDWARENGFVTMAALLTAQGWMKPAGFFVAEQPADMAVAVLPGWTLLRDREYGQTRLAVYRLVPQEAATNGID